MPDDSPPTKEELERIAKCMEKQEFRELLNEYLTAMQDPETKKEEEEYLKQLEREAEEGNYTMQILIPEPAFCVKCRNAAREKVYINICSSDKVEVFREDYTGNSRGCAMWHVPLSVGKPRPEMDKHGKEIETYDAVFNPKTVQLANDSNKFMCFLVEICVEHINEEFKRIGKVQSKGKPAAQSIRVKTDDPNASPVSIPGLQPNSNLSTVNMMPSRTPKPKPKSSASPMHPPIPEEKSKPKPKPKPTSKGTKEAAKAPPAPQWKQPNYTIVHRGEISLGDAWNEREDTKRRLPKELVVRIELPNMNAASEADTLEITEKKIFLKSDKRSYYLDLELPFPVDDDAASAKFDKTKKVLTITVAVKPPHRPDLKAQKERMEKEREEFARQAKQQEDELQKEIAEEKAQKAEEERKAREEKEQKEKARKEEEEKRQKQLEELEKQMEQQRLKRQADEREAKMKAILEKNRKEKELKEKAAKSEQERKEKELQRRMAEQKEQEMLERALKEKESEIALKNRFIFEID